MLINRANLQAIYRSFQVIFNDAFAGATSLYQRIATTVPSSTKEEEYKWLGKIPRMREWIGERIIQNLGTHGFTIKNKSFESTVGIDREDIEDDTIGVYKPIIQELGIAAAINPDELVFRLLMDGFSKVCYDGQYFFDTDHRDGDGPIQSNKSTKKLSHASYGAARATMMSLQAENGQALGVIPDLLCVAPANEGVGLEILQAERMANGATNVYRNSAELLVIPQLAEKPDAWFLLCTKRPVKPIIHQLRKKPEFVAMDKPDDDNVFSKKEYQYGVDSRENAGYGLWQLAHGSTGEEN